MKRLVLLALLGLLTGSGPALAQYYPGGDPGAMVAGWYQRYLHRAPDPQGVQTWVNQLQSGQSPISVLATILGGDEYVQNAGYTALGFVVHLYQDILGRAPEPREENYWLRKLRYENYRDVAYQMLTRYPQGLGASPPPPGYQGGNDYDYRRPYYPYRTRPYPP